MTETEHVDQDDDDDGLFDLPEGAVTNIALIGAGYLFLSNFLTSDEQQTVKQRQESIQNDIQNELENAGSFDTATLEQKVAVYKNMVVSENERVGGECQVDVSAVESELQGEPVAAQALMWKTMAHRVTTCHLHNLQQEPTWYQNLPPEWQNWVDLLAMAGSTAAVLVILKRLHDLGGGGGGSGGVMDTLRDWTDIVRDGVIGDPSVPDVIEDDPDPSEEPQPEPDGSVRGSLRFAGDVVGAATWLLTKIATALGIGADAVLIVTDAAIGGLAIIFDQSEQWFRDHPAETILLAAAVAAAIALATADGPLPLGDAAGVGVVVAAAGVVGVSIDGDVLGDAGQTVRDGLAEETSATGVGGVRF